jgi:hypothetical protein
MIKKIRKKAPFLRQIVRVLVGKYKDPDPASKIQYPDLQHYPFLIIDREIITEMQSIDPFMQ